MQILNIIFYISAAAWLLSEIWYKKILKSEETANKKDQSTLNILWVVILLSVFAGIIFKIFTYFPITTQGWNYYAGLVLIISGVFIRRMIIRSLGKYFTVDVSIRKDHQIKQDGIYRFLRHPSYTFALLPFWGLGLFQNNWFSLIIDFVPVFIAFRYRIKIEERALAETFGKAYEEYRNKTKMLIPFLY